MADTEQVCSECAAQLAPEASVPGLCAAYTAPGEIKTRSLTGLPAKRVNPDGDSAETSEEPLPLFPESWCAPAARPLITAWG